MIAAIFRSGQHHEAALGQTLPQCSHITRKRGVYFWRRRLPRPQTGEVAISLRTRGYRLAEWHAGILDAAFARELQNWLAQGALCEGVPKQILRDNLRNNLDIHRPNIGNACVPEGAFSYPTSARVRVQKKETETLSQTVDIDAANPAHPLVSREITAQPKVGRGPLDQSPTVPARKLASNNVRPTLKHAPSKPLASFLVESFLKSREELDRTTHQVLGQERDTLRIFRDICGDRPVGDYGRADMTHFHETARKLPALRGRSPKDKGLPTAEFIARAAASGEKRISDKTLKRHHSALAQFFRYAMDRGHVDHGQFAALIKNHRFKVAKSAKTQRDLWAPEELTKLFASPVWSGAGDSTRRSQPGSHIVRDGKFWLPILALFHGARLEELADLYGRDVGRDGDIWFIRLEEREGDEDTGERRLKTKNAERVLPLHPELIRLGFPAYVAQTAPKPEDPLFPELEPQGADKKRGPRLTRWFVEYRRDINLYRPGVAMHSFRHTARTRLSDITEGSRERHLNYLFGHAGRGSEGATRYDKGPGLKAVAETLALLNYPEVDLSGLHQCVVPTSTNPAPKVHVSAAKIEPVNSALAGLHEARQRWFRHKVDEAHRRFSGGELALDSAHEGLSRVELVRLNAARTHTDAEHVIESLEDDFASREFRYGRVGATEIGFEGIKQNSQAYEALCSWVMLSLKGVQEARIQWANGDPLFWPACPPWDGLRAALAGEPISQTANGAKLLTAPEQPFPAPT